MFTQDAAPFFVREQIRTIFGGRRSKPRRRPSNPSLIVPLAEIASLAGGEPTLDVGIEPSYRRADLHDKVR